MAVRKEDGSFEPGVIYCLVSGDLYEDWNIFYVGESHDPDRRYKEHYVAGMNATASSTDVYRHISTLHTAKIPWALHIVQHYGSEGPEAAEDEVLAKFLLEGCKLMNMKRGNQWWSDVISDMSRLGFTSYDAYKVHKRAESELKESKKPGIFTLIEPLSKVDVAMSKMKRKIAKESGLLPSRRKKPK